MSSPLWLPPGMVTSGWGIPDRCARHGQPAVARTRVRFATRTPGWVWALMPFGLVLGMLVHAVLKKRVDAPNWPVCGRCRTDRRARKAVGAALLLGCVPLMVLIWSSSVLLAWLAGSAALLAGGFLLASSGWAHYLQGTVDRGSLHVLLADSHPDFRSALPPNPASTQFGGRFDVPPGMGQPAPRHAGWLPEGIALPARPQAPQPYLHPGPQPAQPQISPPPKQPDWDGEPAGDWDHPNPTGWNPPPEPPTWPGQP